MILFTVRDPAAVSFFLLLLLLLLAQETTTSSSSSFTGCEVNDYYYYNASLPADTAEWTRDDLQALLQTSHRNQVTYTNTERPGENDVWAALMDLDAGTVPGTIQLLYSGGDDQVQVDAIPFGSRYWVKEHVHPILGLVEDENSNTSSLANALGKDISDLHNIFPASALSASIRDTKYFGECGILTENPDLCTQPAEGAAEDTCSCPDVYTPPAARKGDIARALLYMDLRYDGSDPFTVNLKLTDCPRIPFVHMGYLSQMLTWHFEDPPTVEERYRNDKICSTYQGNRNPFVDFPELATQLYYEPFDLPASTTRTSYEACDKLPTLPPTQAPNTCDTQIQVGDIYIFLVNSDDPDSVGLYNFAPLPPNMPLYMTDNAWNGTDFVNSVPEVDGTVQLLVPDSGIPAATPMGYHENGLAYSNDWEPVEGNFSLTTQGEAIFLYCIRGDGSPRPLLVFSYGADYVVEDLDPENGLNQTYNETSSSFPWSLGETGLQNIPYAHNLLFDVSRVPDDISTEALKTAVRDPVNWFQNNTSRFSVEDITGASGGAGVATSMAWAVALGTWLLLTWQV